MKFINKYSFLFCLFGLQGFNGLHGDPSDFLYFAFFANLGNIWWYKLGDCEDERFTCNKHKAGYISLRICLPFAVILSILINLSTVDLITLYRFQILILSLTFAIAMNLWAFLTYKFDVGV